MKSLTEYIPQIFLWSEAIMIPTHHIDNNGRRILLFVIPRLGEKICFCITENWEINDGRDYFCLSNFGVESYLVIGNILPELCFSIALHLTPFSVC